MDRGEFTVPENKPSEIEKESLEAHVEICALRYENLQENLSSVKNDVSSIKDDIKALKEAMEEKSSASTDKLFHIGTYIIGGLLTVVGTLVFKMLFH
jgi:hypothetical protein